MKSIPLGPGVALPLEAVTQTFGILAKRGAGKTYTSAVMIEGMIGAGLPVCVVDPVGVWWGLRYGADGKSPGLPVLILGGEHADIPLSPTAGALVADFLVAHHQPVVLDLALFTKGEMRRFVVDFAERLYHAKATEEQRTPLHLVLDEADAFAPQSGGRGDQGAARMLGAVNDLVRRGRARGIGVTLISQRPALVNKDVLTQIEVLIALRMTGPQDRDAVERWVEQNASDDEAKVVLDSLSSLPIGTAWVWSPGWLRILKRVEIQGRKTFDSSSTPKVGEKLRTPKNAAPVDLEALKVSMAETIRESRAKDPRELQARVRELEQQVKRKEDELHGLVTKKAKSGWSEAQLAEWKSAFEHVDAVMDAFLREMMEEVEKSTKSLQVLRRSARDDIQKLIGRLLREARASSVVPESAPPAPAWSAFSEGRPSRAGVRRGPLPPPLPVRSCDNHSNCEFVDGQAIAAGATMPKHQNVVDPKAPGNAQAAPLAVGERTILIAVAQYPEGITREQISILTSYKKSSRDTYLSKLRAAGRVELGGEQVVATAQGIRDLGDFERLPTGRALLEFWMQKLPLGEKRIFEAIVNVYPKGIAKTAIDDATGYKKSSRDTYLRKLLLRKIVTETIPGIVWAVPLLFEAAA